jgi:hypothetical protein
MSAARDAGGTGGRVRGRRHEPRVHGRRVVDVEKVCERRPYEPLAVAHAGRTQRSRVGVDDGPVPMEDGERRRYLEERPEAVLGGQNGVAARRT